MPNQEIALRENPPIMVLSGETPDSVTFRFRGNRWALATLIPGLVLLWLTTKLHFIGHSPTWALAVIGVFGMFLVYSSVYSSTATQWLVASSGTRTIKFYKKNLYGLVQWERSQRDFQGIRVGRHLKSSNWQIALVCSDGLELQLGENAFGAFSYESAFDLATKISCRTGIMIQPPKRT